MLQRQNKDKEIKNTLNYTDNLKKIHLKTNNFPNKILTSNQNWEFSQNFRKTSSKCSFPPLDSRWLIFRSLQDGGVSKAFPFPFTSLLLFLCFSLQLLPPTEFQRSEHDLNFELSQKSQITFALLKTQSMSTEAEEMEWRCLEK